MEAGMQAEEIGLENVGNELEAENIQPVYTDPFVVFPHKVWETIVYSLKDNLETAWNLVRAYPPLREEVIKKAEVLFYKALPLIFPELEKTHVLACRRVCKWWRNTVDHFLENHHSQKPYSRKNETAPKMISLSDKDMQFMVQRYNTSLAEMVRAKTETKSEFGSQAPSIVGRSFAFVHRPVPYPPALTLEMNMSAWYNSLIPFLQLLGPTIHYVSVPVSSLDFTSRNEVHYEELVRCLSHLPNLKSLTCSLPFRPLSNCVDAEAQEHLAQQMDSHPLPLLPTLKCLEFLGTLNNRISLPMQVLTQILRFYFHQVEKLELSSLHWHLPLAADITLPNVRELILCNADTYLIRSTEMVSLVQALSLDKLGKLALRYEFAYVPQVLNLFEQSSNLELVLMEWYPSMCVWKDDLALATFPSVRVLKIRLRYNSNMNHFPDLQVLKCFPGLEHLEFLLPSGLSGDAEQFERKLRQCVINLEEGEQREISVWALFPKLKRFVVNGEPLFQN